MVRSQKLPAICNMLNRLIMDELIKKELDMRLKHRSNEVTFQGHPNYSKIFFEHFDVF